MKDVESDDEVDRNIEELARETLHTDEGDVHARLLSGISEDDSPSDNGVNTSEVTKTYRNTAGNFSI